VERIRAADALVHAGDFSAASVLAELESLCPVVLAVVFGHSHMPLHEEQNGFQVFNPGSPTSAAAPRAVRWVSSSPPPPACASSTSGSGKWTALPNHPRPGGGRWLS
jgi:predicted phosphodiesterase